MTLADLIHGPRWCVMAKFPLEACPTPVPGRYYTQHGATQILPLVKRSRNGYYALARLDVAEIPSRRATRGMRAGAPGVTRHRGRRWAA